MTSQDELMEDAMMKEYQNDVWDIVPKPRGKSIASSKWIYKIKHAADGIIEKYKARFMARQAFLIGMEGQIVS